MLTLHVHTTGQTCPRTGSDRDNTIRLARATDVKVQPRDLAAYRAAWLEISEQPTAAVAGVTGHIRCDPLRIDVRVDGLRRGSRIVIGGRRGAASFTPNTIHIPLRIPTGAVVNSKTRAGRITVEISAGTWKEIISRDITFLAKPTVPCRNSAAPRRRVSRAVDSDTAFVYTNPWADDNAALDRSISALFWCTQHEDASQ